jgi:hypothetical protein
MAGAVQWGAGTPEGSRYDPVTIGAIAEISDLKNCSNRDTCRELRLYSIQPTRTRVPGNATEEKTNARI